MSVLAAEEIEKRLALTPEWRLEAGALTRNFSFEDFREAMSFINQVAAVAEGAGHHPDIDIRYNRVRLGLVTHDAGGVTPLDASMAARFSHQFPA